MNPDEAPGLAQYIQQQCKNLRFSGLMTIGERTLNWGLIC